jgi:hypothetical protein
MPLNRSRLITLFSKRRTAHRVRVAASRVKEGRGARTDGRTDGLYIISSHGMRDLPTEFSLNLLSSVDPASAIYCESIALTRPLRRSIARSSATNNTSQQGLIICCRWQSINHTINFAAARSVSVASTRSYAIWEMDDRIVAKENSRDSRGDALLEGCFRDIKFLRRSHRRKRWKKRASL